MQWIYLLRKPSCRGAIIGLACALIACWLSQTVILRGVENWALDESFLLRGARESNAKDKIAIIALDDRSLNELGKPLMYVAPELAKIIAYLDQAGARAILVDVLIPASLQDNDELKGNGKGDVSLLVKAAANSRKVVFPYLMVKDAPPLLPLEQLQTASLIAGNRLGFANLEPDADLHMRRQALRLRGVNGVWQPSLPLEAYRIAHQLPMDWAQAPILRGATGQVIPQESLLGETEGLRINYVGPPGTIRSVSFSDVLAAADGKHSFDFCWKNMLVLIGEVAAGQLDQHATPYATPSIFQFLRSGHSHGPQLMAGVQIHANTLATLEDAQYIVTPWYVSTTVLLLTFGVLFGVVLANVSLEAGAALLFVHHWVWKAVGVAALSGLSWHVDIASILLLPLIVYAVVFALRWRRIRRMMGLVKSEAVARALEGDPRALDRHGEEREITVLFSDVRDFTSYSENHSPAEVVRLLNEYFSAVIPGIEAWGGTVNQYIGDGVMVIFGAPRRQADHARQAVLCAVEMLQRVNSMQSHWAELGAPSFRIGIGIHTGKAIVGAIGSSNRLDYTAIGDTVNTASRIESGNKELHSELLISQSTFDKIEPADLTTQCAVSDPIELPLKGKRAPIPVRQLMPARTMAGKPSPPLRA